MSHEKYEPVILALLSNATHELAAEAAGIGTATLRRYLKDPEFIRMYREARREVHEFAVGRLQDATARAVCVLCAELCSPKASDRIRAASLILDHATAGSKFIDLADDVEELKKQFEKWQAERLK